MKRLMALLFCLFLLSACTEWKVEMENDTGKDQTEYQATCDLLNSETQDYLGTVGVLIDMPNTYQPGDRGQTLFFTTEGGRVTLDACFPPAEKEYWLSEAGAKDVMYWLTAPGAELEGKLETELTELNGRPVFWAVSPYGDAEGICTYAAISLPEGVAQFQWVTKEEPDRGEQERILASLRMEQIRALAPYPTEPMTLENEAYAKRFLGYEGAYRFFSADFDLQAPPLLEVPRAFRTFEPGYKQLMDQKGRVSAEQVEARLEELFALSPEQIRQQAGEAYDSVRQCYDVLPKERSFEFYSDKVRQSPPYVCYVRESWYEEGKLILHCEWYTEQGGGLVFAHRLTIEERGEGAFTYVANKVL